MSNRPLVEILKVLAADLTGLQKIAADMDDGLGALALGSIAGTLQQVDFLQQYLHDLAATATGLSQQVPEDIDIDVTLLADSVKLDDLRRHLLGTACAVSVDTRESGEVSLF